MEQQRTAIHPSGSIEHWLVQPEVSRELLRPALRSAYGPWISDLVPELSAELKTLRKNRAAWQIQSLEVLRRVDAALAREGVPAWILKGPSLAFRYYRSALHRPYTDLDILIRPKHWERARRALLACDAVTRVPAGSGSGTNFREVMEWDGIPLELHFRLLTQRRFPWPLPSRPTAIPGVHWIQELDPHLNFVYLCGHGAFQPQCDELFWLFDLDLLLRSESLQWALLDGWARQMRLRRSLALSLGWLARTFRTPMPEGRPPGMGAMERSLLRFLDPLALARGELRVPRWRYVMLQALIRDSLWESLNPDSASVKESF